MGAKSAKVDAERFAKYVGVVSVTVGTLGTSEVRTNLKANKPHSKTVGFAEQVGMDSTAVFAVGTL